MRQQPATAAPVWFHVPKEYALPENDGTLPIHSFFDLTSGVQAENKTVRYVTLAGVDSQFGYDIDLLSGKLFRRHHYCSEADVWKREGKRLRKPPGHYGFVPRLLDQTGAPQKILVFGQSRIFEPFSRGGEIAQTARVVGGAIHQYCDQYPCETRERWLSSLVLIAVNPDDPKMEKVRELEDLKKVVNWSRVQSFMENSFGRNVSGAHEQPAYRFLGEISAERALDHAFSRGHHFSFDEMTTMRRSCHALYDFFWESSELVRKNIRERRGLDRKSLDDFERLKHERLLVSQYSFENNVLKAVENKAGPIPAKALGQYSLFLDFFIENYGRQFAACSKFVRDSNLKENRERHWYFAYVRAYLQLEELGYVYHCNRQSWMENFVKADGKRTFDPKKERRQCLDSQLDRAFESAITLYVGIKRSFRPHYRYIEYDGNWGGTHQQIYSWIYDNGKRLSCDQERGHDDLIYPNDISWKPFYEEASGPLEVIR